MMSVRTFFLACLSAIAAAALLASFLLIQTQWDSWSRATDAGELASVLHNALKASELTGLERGTYNVALLADAPATNPADQQEQAKRKAALDEALAATRAGLVSAPVPHREEVLAEFDRLVGDLAHLRSEVAVALPLPKDGRAALNKSYYGRMVAFIAGLARIVDSIQGATSAAQPQVGALTSIGQLAWDMRYFSGVRVNTFVRIIISGKLPASDVMEAGVGMIFGRRAVTPLGQTRATHGAFQTLRRRRKGRRSSSAGPRLSRRKGRLAVPGRSLGHRADLGQRKDRTLSASIRRSGIMTQLRIAMQAVAQAERQCSRRALLHRGNNSSWASPARPRPARSSNARRCRASRRGRSRLRGGRLRGLRAGRWARSCGVQQASTRNQDVASNVMRAATKTGAAANEALGSATWRARAG